MCASFYSITLLLQPPTTIPDEVVEWKKQRSEFNQQWGQLSAAIKGSVIDPLSANCSLDPSAMLEAAANQIEGLIYYARVYCHVSSASTLSKISFKFTCL